MVEIEAFSDDNFYAIDWINATFRNSDHDGQPNKEIRVSSLVSKLQLYVQQVNSALEETSQQVLTGMPRIMKDTQNLQNDALLMRAKMTEVQNDIAQVQKKTGACMEKLEHLDEIKTKLQIAKEQLQESDGWGRLTTELEDYLEQNDIAKACEKIEILQKSLIAQAGLPGQNERHSQVETFKNRMEALTSAAVVTSFTTNDIENSKKHVEIYTKMDRLPHLTHYYRSVSKGLLQQQWSEVIDLATNSGSPRFLREFNEYLIEYWKKQYKWCTNVFGSTIGAAEPTAVIVELFSILEPTRQQAINNCLKLNDDKLAVLAEISSATLYFGTIMQKQLNSVNVKPAAKQISEFTSAIYDFFATFVATYGQIEQNQMLSDLNGLELEHTTATESVRALGNANSKLFEWCDKAMGRCDEITQNCGIFSLVNVLNNVFKTFLEKYKRCYQKLHASRGTAQNWALLQTCISLLQHIGDFRIQLQTFEMATVEKVLSKKDLLATGESFPYFGYKLIGQRDRNEFQRLFGQCQAKKDELTDEAEHSKCGAFSEVFDATKPICEYIHDAMLAIVFYPIESQLKAMQLSEPTSDTDSNKEHLPDYSFAPQEFITEIGQYLLTLPQHLEPLLLLPSLQLRSALEQCDERYSTSVASADVLLSLLSDECCALYEEKIGQITSVDTIGAKQLATDIEYLGSVLEELGLSLGSRLQQTIVLLRAAPENYLSLSTGCDPRLVTAIRQIRNIISSE